MIFKKIGVCMVNLQQLVTVIGHWHSQCPVATIARLRRDKLLEAKKAFELRNGGENRLSEVNHDYSNLDTWGANSL